MEIRVLKVRREANLDELNEGISVGHTVARQGLGGWQMPKPSQVGDLAVWYSGDPHQEFVADRARQLARLMEETRTRQAGPAAAR